MCGRGYPPPGGQGWVVLGRLAEAGAFLVIALAAFLVATSFWGMP